MLWRYWNLIPVQLVKDSEYVEEEIDDVEVQVDGGEDVFFRGQGGHHHLCVEDEEEAEQDGADEGEGDFEPWALDEQLQDTANDEHRQTRE